MQTAAIGVLGWELTESPAYLGLLVFSQLGPMSILSLVGGSLADTANRRVLLLSTQTWQMLWTLVLAALVIDDVISPSVLLLMVFVIGLGQGIQAPVYTSILPVLAGHRNIKAAISLNSVQTNSARVVGPAIGGFLVANFGFAEVFAINGLSYIFVLAAVWVTQIPAAVARRGSLANRLFGGFRVAWRARQVGSPLLLMMLFVFFCLPFIGQLPAIAELNLGIDARSTQYGWFYAAFGAGGLTGALVVGTVFAQVPARRMIRMSLLGFSLALAILASLRSFAPAIPAVYAVGACYFMLPTTLASQWQEHVDESIRGRVAALWALSFGGTVPFANALAGPIIEATSLGVVLYGGAIVALGLGLLYRLVSGPVVGEELLLPAVQDY